MWRYRKRARNDPNCKEKLRIGEKVPIEQQERREGIQVQELANQVTAAGVGESGVRREKKAKARRRRRLRGGEK